MLQFVWLGHVVTDLIFHHSFVFLFLNIYYPASSEEQKKTHKIDSASEWIEWIFSKSPLLKPNLPKQDYVS